MPRKSELSAVPAISVKEVDFFQLVRSIERETGLRLGGDLKPQDEPVVLKADSDANFAATQVCSWNVETERPEVKVAFYGLFGPSGALPRHYTEVINHRARVQDFALRDFLDMFNHRLLSFFYRCWEKHKFPVAFETAHFTKTEDCCTGALRALIGMRTEHVWDRLSFPSSDLLYFAGHLSNQRATSSALTDMVGEAFDVQVELEQFVGQLMLIAPDDQTRLGDQPLGFSLGNQVGTEAIAGQRIWDFENKFRLRIGPLSFARFSEFHPQSESKQLRRLFDLVRTYVGPQYDVEVQVILKQQEVKVAQLDDKLRGSLGWNTWLGDWPFDTDADQPVFQLSDVP